MAMRCTAGAAAGQRGGAAPRQAHAACTRAQVARPCGKRTLAAPSASGDKDFDLEASLPDERSLEEMAQELLRSDPEAAARIERVTQAAQLVSELQVRQWRRGFRAGRSAHGWHGPRAVYFPLAPACACMRLNPKRAERLPWLLSACCGWGAG